MTNAEMLKKMLEQSGWTVTDETDEDGAKVCKADQE